MTLHENDNMSAESEDEILTIQKGLLCYKISTKSKSFQKGLSRTFEIEFGSHLKDDQLPPNVIFFVTSEDSAYGVEHALFPDGAPYVSEVQLNHKKSVLLKPERREYLKESRSGCSEGTRWKLMTKTFKTEMEDMCPVFCTPFLLPDVPYEKCVTYFDLKCSGNVFFDALAKVTETYGSACIKPEYVVHELEPQTRLEGFPKIVICCTYDMFNYVDFQFSHNYQWSKKPTVKFTYKYDTPETVDVYQEYIIISFIDLIGVVGGTLSLYVGLAFYDSFFQVLSNCNLLMINMMKVYNRIKGIKKTNVTVSNENQMEPKGQNPTNEEKGESDNVEEIENVTKSEVNEESKMVILQLVKEYTSKVEINKAQKL